MSFPNLYFGCVSKNVVDAVIDLSNKDQIELGLIASRRQVDYNGGYTGFTSQKLYEYVRKRADMVYICRDHGGPNQGITNDSGKKSFTTDSRCMDVIHVDPWLTSKTINDGIKSTIDIIKACHKNNKNVKFEIGTEEVIYRYTPLELRYILQELERNLNPYEFGNIVFACVQGGTKLDLLNRQNIGIYNEQLLLDFLDVCGEFAILTKEHNGDFLTDDAFISRFNLGLTAINIAPELSCIESKFIWDRLFENESYSDLNTFHTLCQSAPYSKWLNGKTLTDYTKEDVCIAFGHYIYNTPEFIQLKQTNKIYDYDIVTHIRDYISRYLDILYNFDEGEMFDE